MRHPNRNTIFASFGVATVLVELASVAIGAIGNRAFVTITSSPADVRSAFAKPVTTAAWVSAYMEMLSVGLFLAFAVWACARLGGGLVGSIATGAAVAYAAVGTVGLAVGDALAYRSGHGMDLQLATAMMTLNQALFVASWFLSVFFLLAVAPLALAAGRSVIGWSAVCIAVVILVTTAVSLDNLGQMSNMLWLIWIAGTAIGLARPGRVEATAAADAALA